VHGSGIGEFLNPRDVGVDSAGNIYVLDARNSRIVKLDPAGSWLASWNGPANDTIAVPLGLSVSNEKIYLADSGKNKVRVFDLAGNQLLVVQASTGTCAITAPRDADADADADGNIYVANYKANNVVKFTSTGACTTAWGTTGGGDGQFRALYGVRVAPDPVLGQAAVYVADANNNRVQEFTTSGAFVAKFGSEGSGPGQFLELRRAAVAANGDVWTADLWGWRLQRFARTAAGYSYAQTIGTPVPPPTDTAVFHEPRQIAFDAAGNLHVADTVHHRIVRMTPSGSILSVCGARGGSTGEFNWPRGVAVDQATGQIWVADTKQYRLQIIGPDCKGLTKFGSNGTGNDQFNWPYGVVIRQSDRIAFVADTMNNRIKSYDVASRAFIASFGTKGTGTGQFREPGAIAVNPANGRILVADSLNHRIVELSDHAGAGFAVTRTLSAALSEPAGVAADAAGNVFVADSGNSRVVVFGADGSVRAVLDGPGEFDQPEGLSVDSSGRLLVADTYHDRIRRYSALGPGPDPVPDTAAPDSNITAPKPNSVVPRVPVVATGTATDNVAVARVRVAVKNRKTGLWWHTGGTWGSYVAYDAALAQPGSPSTTWTYRWTPPAAGQYTFMAEATDAAGNREAAPKPSVPFTVG
jgi:sugar lactone lactonase YvrE